TADEGHQLERHRVIVLDLQRRRRSRRSLTAAGPSIYMSQGGEVDRLVRSSFGLAGHDHAWTGGGAAGGGKPRPEQRHDQLLIRSAQKSADQTRDIPATSRDEPGS